MTEFTEYFLIGCTVALMVAGPLALWISWHGYKRAVAAQEAEKAEYAKCIANGY